MTPFRRERDARAYAQQWLVRSTRSMAATLSLVNKASRASTRADLHARHEQYAID